MHPHTALTRVSLEVLTKTDSALPRKKKIINIAFLKKLQIYSEVLTPE